MEMSPTKRNEQYVNSVSKHLKKYKERTVRINHMYALFNFGNDNSNENNANLSRYFEKTC